jgi:hypothetical protein
MGKLSLFITILAFTMVTSLLVTSCSSSTTQTQATSTVTTESTAVTSATTTSLSEGDISRVLLQHLISTPNTAHGKQVVAKLFTVWGHGYGQEPFTHNQDGSWLAIFSLNEAFVQENQILQPIFENPTEKKYLVEWLVSEDGLKFTPSNDNAIRLEGELGK